MLSLSSTQILTSRNGDFTGGVGPAVDIRPPQQVLSWSWCTCRASKRWSNVMVASVQKKQTARRKRLPTCWLNVVLVFLPQQRRTRLERPIGLLASWRRRWCRDDRRHSLSLVSKRITVMASRLTLLIGAEGNKEKPVTANLNKERYTAFSNESARVRQRLTKKPRAEAALKAQELVKRIPISMGSDRSGFPCDYCSYTIYTCVLAASTDLYYRRWAFELGRRT